MWDRERDLVGERTLHVQLCASSGKILDVEERDAEREMEAQRGGVHLPRVTQHHGLNPAPPDSMLNQGSTFLMPSQGLYLPSAFQNQIQV